MPLMDELFDSLSRAEHFLTLNLSLAYWHVKFNPRRPHQNGVHSSSGLNEFERMPIRLRNAPAIFQRLMQEMFMNPLPKRALVYSENVILCGLTHEEHNTNPNKVFRKLKAAGLELKLSKYHLSEHEVKFMNHGMPSIGIRKDPDKIEQIGNWLILTSEQERRSFLSLVSYYRRFIVHHPFICRPLNVLLDLSTEFE